MKGRHAECRVPGGATGSRPLVVKKNVVEGFAEEVVQGRPARPARARACCMRTILRVRRACLFSDPSPPARQGPPAPASNSTPSSAGASSDFGAD